LNADELKILCRNSLNLEIKLDPSRIRSMTSSRDRARVWRPGSCGTVCDVKTLLVALDHDVKLALHIGLPPSIVDESSKLWLDGAPRMPPREILFSSSPSYTCHVPSLARAAPLAYREAVEFGALYHRRARTNMKRKF
jgi:hypothetical protein